MDFEVSRPGDAQRLIDCLLRMEEGWYEGNYPIPPERIDPLLGCQAANAVPEFITYDESGWSVHLRGGVVRRERGSEPDTYFRLFNYEDWAFFCECQEMLRGGPDDFGGADDEPDWPDLWLA